MQWKTRQLVINVDLALDWVQALTVVPGAALLATLRLRLFTDMGLVPAPGTPFASFTEATFDGYSEVTPVPSLPILSPPYTMLIQGSGLYVAGPAIGGGETVYGYYLTNDPPTVWYAAERILDPDTGLPLPYSFATPGQFLNVTFGIGLTDLVDINL